MIAVGETLCGLRVVVCQGQPSTVRGSVTADTSHVLKGVPYTSATVTIVPTAYAHYSDAERLGVISKWNSQARGAQYTPETMRAAGGGDPTQAGFGATLTIESFGAALAVAVTQRQTWPVILAQLLAILSGSWTVGKVIVASAQHLCYGSSSPSVVSGVVNVVAAAGPDRFDDEKERPLSVLVPYGRLDAEP
jgi:hypothetical protein